MAACVPSAERSNLTLCTIEGANPYFSAALRMLPRLIPVMQTCESCSSGSGMRICGYEASRL